MRAHHSTAATGSCRPLPDRGGVVVVGGGGDLIAHGLTACDHFGAAAASFPAAPAAAAAAALPAAAVRGLPRL